MLKLIRNLIPILILLAAGFVAKGQSILYVDSSVLNSGSGLSWSTAYKTLGEALTTANGASTSTTFQINVAKGTYYPPGVQSSINRNNFFQIIRGGVRILGGYPTGGGSRNIGSNPTILSGNIGNAATAADNSHHVLVAAGITSSSDSILLDGLQFTVGVADGVGSAVLNTENILRNQGAGIYLQAVSSPFVIKDCNISSNKAGSGGGIYASNSTLFIVNSRIQGNAATVDGGGIYNSGSNLHLFNCLLTGNKANSNGGALFNINSTSAVNIEQCTFAGNSAASGNAIHSNNTSGTVLSSILWDGSGISIINVNSASFSITYSIVEGGYTGVGNTSTDPVFMSPISASAAPTTTGNYELAPCSPAINTGQNAASYNNLTDLAGNPRIFDTTVDRGAYEFQSSPFSRIVGDSSICPGSSIQLSNTVVGGNWVSSNTAVLTVSTLTGLVSGISQGTAIVSYTVGGQCAGTATKTITVNANPTAPTISGVSALCLGSSITLTGSPSGGVWFSPNTSLLTVTSAGLVTGINTGSDSISYTITSSAGCNARSAKLITVNPLPIVEPITGGNSVCVDDTLQLRNASTGGIWSITGAATAAIDFNTGLLTGVSFGTATATYTYTAGPFGCSAIATKAIQIYALPTVPPISGANRTCFNGTTQLTNTTTGGVWSSSNTGIATVSTTGMLMGIGIGTTTVSYTVTNGLGCVKTVTRVQEVVQPYSNVPVNGSICNGAAYFFGPQILTTPGTYTQLFQSSAGCDSSVLLTLSAVTVDNSISQNNNTLKANQNGATYQWVNCATNSNILGATSQTFVASGVGNYQVRIGLDNCLISSNCVSVTTVSVQEVNRESLGLSIYPNPSREWIHVMYSSLQPGTILIKDMTGHVIKTIQASANSTVISIKDLTPGLYLVELQVSGSRAVAKLMINR